MSSNNIISISRSYLILFLVIISVIGCNRDDELAANYIRQLKDGVVLVRLKTSNLQVAKLIELGKVEEAKEKVILQQEKNLKIVKSFSKYFNFCKVYFFYSNNSELVKQKKTEGIFLDLNLNVDSSIKLNEVNVFIVDIGDLFFDAFSSHSEGIGIMNQDFELLVKPFPYYIGKSRVLPVFKRSTDELIEMLNEELHAFYYKTAK